MLPSSLPFPYCLNHCLLPSLPHHSLPSRSLNHSLLLCLPSLPPLFSSPLPLASPSLPPSLPLPSPPLAPQITVLDGQDLDFETRDTYSFGLIATDGGGLSATATITVTLTNVNEPPVLEDTSRAVRENSESGTVIEDGGGPIMASDPDQGDLLLYTIVGGNDAGIFKIGPCTGKLEVVLAQLDHEAKAFYDLTVSVAVCGCVVVALCSCV